jgi:hypothetical protein
MDHPMVSFAKAIPVCADRKGISKQVIHCWFENSISWTGCELALLVVTRGAKGEKLFGKRRGM